MASLTSYAWQGNANPGNEFNFLRLDFDEAVTGLTNAEVTVTGDASFSGILISSLTALFLRFELNDQTTGTFSFTIAASALSPALDADISLTISWDASNAITITESTPEPPANNAPAFSLNSYSFPDVAIAIGTIVGTVAATDADDDTLTYTLTGANASNFSIDSNGQITVATALTNGATYNFTVNANDQTVTTSVPVTVVAVAAVAVTPALDWIVPSSPVGNTFSVTLTSNVPLDAPPVPDDLRLRDDDNSDPAITINSANTTISAIAGTNNYLIELELTGTYDDTYTIRINGNTVEYNGVSVITAQLRSAVFSIDSSIVATTPTPPTFTEPASDYAVNERANRTIDSTEFFSGHTSLAPKTGTTLPSWITISGLNVVLTGAPSVTDDTDYDIELTATNDDGDVDGTITAQVNQIDPAPVIGTIPRIDINEGQSRTVDLSSHLQNTDTLVITSSQSWVSVSGLSVVITSAPAVDSDTDYTVQLRAESDATSATDTGSVVIRVADVPTPVVEPVTLGWVVPSEPVGNTFSATLTSNYPLTGLDVGDFRLRDSDNSDPAIPLNTTNTTITQVEGTNNIRLDIVLTGTYDDDYTIRVNGESVQANGMSVPDAQLASAAFRIDSSTGQVLSRPDPATNLRRVSATPTELVIAWRAPSNNGGAELTSYKINVDGTITDTGSTATTARLTGFTASETVSISVAAVNAEGTSDYSDPLQATTDAEFTISTTETDIRERQRFDISIAATGAVTNFTRGDVSVSGATVNAFTENASDDYTLNVTADAGGGNIVISINEDVVSPGNASVSKTFTRKAFPTVTATVANPNLRPGARTPVIILWSEVVTGLSAPEVSVDVGSLSNFQGQNHRYTVFVTAPTTPPTGEITLRIAANAVDQGNAPYSVKIFYSTPSPPIWQPRSALQGSVDALETRRINIANLVRRANNIEIIGGYQSWLDFDGTDLIVTEAPIVRDNTELRVKLRASNADGYRDAFYILTVNASKLAMLRDTLFFKPSITYDGDRVRRHGTSIIVREMTDNNYETYSTETDIDVDITDADGTATVIDFVFLMYKGDLTEYRFTTIGRLGTSLTRTVPTTLENYEGGRVALEVEGFKYDLYPLPTQVSARSARMRFTGSDVEIYALMFLEFGLALDANALVLDMKFNKVDRTGGTRQSPSGSGSRDTVLAAERAKWEYLLNVFLKPADAKRLFYWMEQHLKFGFVPEFARHPDRIFEAFWGDLTVQGEYFSQNKGNGYRIEFKVSEQ